MAEESVAALTARNAATDSWDDDRSGQPQSLASVHSTSLPPAASLPSSPTTPLSASAAAAASSDASQLHLPVNGNGSHSSALPASHFTANGHDSHVSSSTAAATDTSHSLDASGVAAQQQQQQTTDAAAASRKRSSRWGDPDSNTEPNTATSTPATTAPTEPRKRSRWGDKETSTTPTSTASTLAPVTVAGATPAMAAALTAASIAAKLGQSTFLPASLDEVKTQLRIDELTRLMVNPLAHLSPDAPRSPEPEPTYDSQGQRTNTREQRYKARHTAERNELILQLTAANATYKPPSDWKRQTRFERRIYIPVKDFPDYNFIGLIIGPRGTTQKQMEKETGCKIVIRGKGSSKEGKSRTSGRVDESENDETHVLVTGEDRAKVDAAAVMVERLMVPVDDATNEHKSKQLRELALINGTLRDDIVCRVCGQRGHKLFECPERTGAAWRPAEVKCEYCGETSHISVDCPRREEGKERREEWDAEYASFMNEITGGNLADKGISGLIEENKRGNTAADGSTGRLGEGGRSGQLMLTDGVDRRPSNTLRVGDGIVRRIVSNDPRENAREYRPLNPQQHSSSQPPLPAALSASSGYIHPSRMPPSSSYHAVPPPSSASRPPPPPLPPQPSSYGGYHPPHYPYYPPPSHYYPQPPPPGSSAGAAGGYPPSYYTPPPAPSAAAPPAMPPAMPQASHAPLPPVSTAAPYQPPASAATDGAGRANRYAQWPPPASLTMSSTTDKGSFGAAASKPTGVNRYAQWPPPSV